MLTQVMARHSVPTWTDPAALVTRSHARLTTAGLDVPVRLWDGTELGPPNRGYRVLLRHPWSLRNAILGDDDLGAGEAYLCDDVDVEGSMVAALRDLSSKRTVLTDWRLQARLFTDLVRLPAPPTRAGPDGAQLNGQAHSRSRDRDAIQFHYDVGNDFYQTFLDRRMVYSCAYFTQDAEAGDPGPEGDLLDRAQLAKLDLICRKLHLQPGDDLLDLGCGWGALVIHAATHYGVRATGITLSEQQVHQARQRAAAAGVADRVDIRLQDYREATGPYDAVASVGMFEHVGSENLRDYFAICHELLRPGGRLLNHGITTGHRDTVRDFADVDSFVSRHVFPDGALVPAHVAVTHLEQAGFELIDVEQLRPHYARTLAHWVARIEHNRVLARATGGQVGYRTWRAYMAGSALGFETGDLGVIQLLGTRGDAKLPLGRRWMLPDT